MVLKPKTWLPEIGDLVAVPELGIAPAAGIRQKSSYGIVVGWNSNQKRSAIFFQGGVKWFDNIILMPLWNKEGEWLQVGKSET